MKNSMFAFALALLGACSQAPEAGDIRPGTKAGAKSTPADDQQADSGDSKATSSADDTAATTTGTMQTVSTMTTQTTQTTMDTTTAGDTKGDTAMQTKPAYNPCPTDGSPCKIMPYGDSITFGYGSKDSGGYRVGLLQKAWAAKQKITFVGAQSSGPAKVDGKDFIKANAGYSGYTIQNLPDGSRKGITELCDDLMKKYEPHIVTLQIGTNDIGANYQLDKAPERLGKLIDKIIADNPKTLVVVAQIVPTTDDKRNEIVKTYNTAIAALVKDHADAGKHVIMVDMYSAMIAHADFKTALYNDGLHPKEAGYDVMAGVWYEALKGLFKE